MTKVGTKVVCFDNTGVKRVKIFKKIGVGDAQTAKLGDLVYVSVIGLNRKAKNLKDEKQRKRYRLGSLHRAIVIHVTTPYRRKDNTRIWFVKDAVVLTDRKGQPLSKKVKTALPRELTKLYPQVASISVRIC